MLRIEKLEFNPFQTNTYVVSDATGQCLVIDAGCYTAREDARLVDYIRSNDLTPTLALNTHGHIDHVLGVGYVKETFDVPFALHGADRFLVDPDTRQEALYGLKQRAIPMVDIDLGETPEIRFGETTLQVIHTPGHTPGHVCFYCPEKKILFTGDTLFRESIGRTDLPGGDYSWIMKSILEKIVPLGGDVAIYPGHGPSSTIGHEMMYNPFVTEVLNGEVNY